MYKPATTDIEMVLGKLELDVRENSRIVELLKGNPEFDKGQIEAYKRVLNLLKIALYGSGVR